MFLLKVIGSLWQKYYRPLIYVATLLLVWLGAVTNRPLSISIEDATKGAFDTIENLPALRAESIRKAEALLERMKADPETPQGDIVAQQTKVADLKANPKGVLLISFDFDPGSDAEMQPQIESMLRHCFSRGTKVVMNIGLSVMSQPLAQLALDKTAAEGQRLNPPYPRMESGKDYVFLGFRPNSFQLYLQMGESIIAAYETDYAGTDLATMPMMQHIKSFNEIDAIVSVSAFVGTPETWLSIAGAKYNKPLILGMGAIGASDYYPFIQSGQICGLLPGVRGAAEYETALKCPDMGSKRMWSQLYAHSFAIVLILIGNIEYFMKPKRRQS